MRGSWPRCRSTSSGSATKMATTARAASPTPGCCSRRPRPIEIDLPASFMVGDRWRDVEAGRRAGCRTVFIDLGYAERRPEPPAEYTLRISPPP